MPTRVLLEGPAIEPLLAQVREEYGSGVRIISADKIRSGGFAGFFAKQHYELSVEVPDEPAEPREPAAGPRPGTAPDTIEELLARAESGDEIAPDDARAATGRASGGGADDPAGRDTTAGRDLTAGREAAAGRARSDTGAAFAELMAGLDRLAAAPRRPAGRPGPGDEPALRELTAAPARPEPGRPEPGAPEPDRPERARGDVPTVRPFRPAKAAGAPVNGSRPPAPVPSLAELMGGLGVGGDGVVVDPATVRHAPGSGVPARTAASAYGVGTPPARTAGPVVPEPAAGPAPANPVVANLVSVGMPADLAERITGADTYAGVLSVLADRPAAPAVPDAPGEILVLAGDLAHVVPIGRQLLQQAGVDPTHLLLAGPSAAGTGVHSSKVVHTAAAARARAEKLHADDKPWVVVLDAPVGRTDPVFVQEVREALGAVALWAVVDATRKTADTARHLRTLGEVEALVVHGVELTTDPATVLGLDLPIVSLDGRPATPHAWAAMLCERIAADVAPPPAPARRGPRPAR